MGQVSVLIPVRNGAATIAEALASVLAEPEVGEVVVIDDRSTDGTRAAARAAGDGRVRIVEGPGEGIAGALNAGLAAVRLPFVARCDADDRFEAGRLAWQLAFLQAHPEYVAVSGGYWSTDPRGRVLALLAAEGAAREVTDLLIEGRTVTHFCTWLSRREALEAVGGARRWFVTAEDLDLQFRLASAGRVWHDPRPTYHYRLHQASITHVLAEERGAFYEAAARRFARQRREGGPDDLERGAPPAFAGGTATPSSAAVQAAGHLESAAWRRFRAGDRRDALRLMLRSVATDPLSVRRWRSAAALAARLLRRA